MSVLRLIPNTATITEGEILYKGQNLLKLDENNKQYLKEHIQKTILDRYDYKPLEHIQEMINEVIDWFEDELQAIESISISKSRKKSKNHYSEVIFAGLRQPTKNISLSTYEILNLFIKRFKVSDLDICFDGLSELEINDNTLNMYRYLFKDYISNFKDTLIEKSSFYINTPSSPIADTDYFKKILVYEKYLKESRYKNLDDELKDRKSVV